MLGVLGVCLEFGVAWNAWSFVELIYLCHSSLVTHAILSLTSWQSRCIAQFATCPGWCSRAPVAGDSFVVVVCGKHGGPANDYTAAEEGNGYIDDVTQGMHQLFVLIAQRKASDAAADPEMAAVRNELARYCR